MARHNKGTAHYSVPNAERKSPRMTVTIPAALETALRAEAARRGLTLSAAVAAAIRSWVPTPAPPAPAPPGR